LCSKDGKSFEECSRPMWAVGDMVELLGSVLAQSVKTRVVRRLGRLPDEPRRQYFREPVRRPVGGLLG
jgi:hypothetical protein